MYKLKLSIIIVNYNTKGLVVECIKSINKFNPKTDHEVIVVDNGSSDGSLKSLKKLKEKGLIDKLLLNDKNLGFAKANNQGLRISKGKYKLLLNSDTKVKKGALDELVKSASKVDDAGAIGARLLNPDGSVQASAFYLPTVKRAIIHYWLGGRKYFNKYIPEGPGLVKVEALTMAALLITPKAIKKAGYLNEKYFMYFEDLDYARKLKEKNLAIYYDNGAKVIHKHGASGKNVKDKKNQWRRLIPGSKTYHGILKHYIIQFILWSGQKLRGGSKSQIVQ
jgi:GT2 family glycosyltransferase